MANLINEAEIRATWAPIIESATGINDANKLAWMSEYCHNHKLYEEASLTSVTPMMLAGMGHAALPVMGNGSSVSTANGSGDKAPTLLPLAMQVAAQTIALDLVPVVPMAGPMGLLSYLDFVYDGGAARSQATLNVLFVKASAAPTDLVADPKVGDSRLDGVAIYKVTLAGAGDIAADHFPAGTTLELVKALEDHVAAFAGDNNGNPFSRQAGETTPENIMGLSLYSKSVAAETFQVAAAVTREQVQDLKQFGVDAVAQVESVLTNELTQAINTMILSKMRSIAGSDIATLDLAPAAVYGGETRSEAHRRILTNILAAANVIANKGRRGAGNFAVVDWKTASALQGIAGFVPNPMANTFSQVAGAIYPLGSVAGINIYTDPNQAVDGEVLVGRKGDGNGSGLVFMPYLMAESVQTIAEGTMAPKIAVKSRFALVEAGHHPELNYQKFEVTNLVL
jgi:hypothetical protein